MFGIGSMYYVKVPLYKSEISSSNLSRYLRHADNVLERFTSVQTKGLPPFKYV